MKTLLGTVFDSKTAPAKGKYMHVPARSLHESMQKKVKK